MLERGLVQIYTGDGKGKTTAAFGLALRAAGRGRRVLIYQFLKPPAMELGERLGIERSGLPIRLEALDAKWDVFGSLRNEQDVTQAREAIRNALATLAEAAGTRAYDVLILDEIVFCASTGLAELSDVRNLVERRDPHVELVLTGRGATPELVALADLVTEMRKIKHPFDHGVPARPGIDY
ncbi:MAG TPA: cob(I)yrinic acid a,c-diamide adenosyltransferase [Sedimentisphaerales bacterium]|jgi:cob(I)alamin adenosyltransferase|nr:cob(I)yrinic acid a,c-diamide adenosyltransferase [Sedimentisphaerales bacterium]HNU29745.1 cob(I)yrinic acid a,c-diamide adenosyltransferase [Sedimentisphaerales bacterium]